MSSRPADVPRTAKLLLSITAIGALITSFIIVVGPGPGVVSDWSLPVLVIAGASAVMLRIRARCADRLAWSLVAAAMVLWGAAEVVDLVWTAHVGPLPAPSFLDPMWLAYYPLMVVALGLLVRRRIGKIPNHYWLDVAIGVATTASLAAILTAPLVAAAPGATAPATIVNAAYPLGDFVTLLTVIAVMMLCGRRSPMWILLICTQILFVAADSAYLDGVGSDASGGVLTIGWPLGALGMALAAWCRDSPIELERRPPTFGALATPAACGAVSVIVLVWDHFDRLSGVAILLAAGAALLLTVRLTMLFKQNEQLIKVTHREANTDALTGLGNRRALLRALDQAGVPDAEPSVLVLFDLDGFKSYNDAFGHPAGDVLLQRLGRRLAASAAELGGRAFRPGGDEFCIVLDRAHRDADGLARRACAALGEQGEGFTISASWGTALLPSAAGPTAALGIADRAMYERKSSARISSTEQTVSVLLAVARERYPELSDHASGVADAAEEIARHLGLPPQELKWIRLGGVLHDIGKVAIPSWIINKPGPLDDQEWHFIRRHTAIGDRILLAAPDLRAVAPIVRSSHERWDGMGYPDHLAGDAIPLGARIVGVCDAFDAMISTRSYSAAMTTDEALAEISRCAGTQFDPTIVDALQAVMADRRNLLAIAAAPSDRPHPELTGRRASA
jgi:diguanylate cyclase (GGDEF)-like protein